MSLTQTLTNTIHIISASPVFIPTSAVFLIQIYDTHLLFLMGLEYDALWQLRLVSS